jgi:hypothetical protein
MIAHLCVHVLLARDVSKPMRWLKRPACAIMIPLSIQKLTRDIFVLSRWVSLSDRIHNIPFIRCKDSATSFGCHDTHHFLQSLVA